MSNPLLEIDGEKFKDAIENAGYIPARLSETMGFNRYYLSNCASRGKIPKYSMELLTHITGIVYDDVAAEEEKQEPELDALHTTDDGFLKFLEQHKIVLSFDYDRLNSAVYSAVYGALKKAYNDGFIG